MRRSAAEVIREYGPFEGIGNVAGVTYDGTHLWFATGDGLQALDLSTGRRVRTIDVPAKAGTTFDGRYLYQMSGGEIRKIDPATGEVLSTIPSPGVGGDSGLAWADGTLWVGQYKARAIHQIDPETGAILRTLESNRFVTGVTWVDGELWHGTIEDGASEVCRVDPQTGELLASLAMPAGAVVSGLESDGGGQLFCGGATSCAVRVIRRPTSSD